MVYFTEKLINEIRERSCIWDTTDVNHLNKEVLSNMWMEIAGNLYSDWNRLSGFDQRDRVSDVKKKWTNIKDSFVKDVKGNKPKKSRCLPEHRKKYYLFDHLQFLLPFIQDSKSGSGGKSARKKTRKNPQGEGTSRISHTVHAVSPSDAPETTEKPETLQPDVQQHADLLNNIAGKTAADALCQLDGDLSFMVSLLPTVKSMNERQKINFKIGVLQLMSRIKFDDGLQHSTDATYQPFITPHELGGFPLPYQHLATGIGYPFVNHGAVPSTRHQQRQHHHRNHRHRNQAQAADEEDPAVKLEVVYSSPASSSCFETNPEDDSDT